jgi:photoactive yellow protein
MLSGAARNRYMTTETLPRFDQPDILKALTALDAHASNRLDFGLIAFNANGIVRHYNKTEACHTGLDPAWVCGQHVFTAIAQCMNNYLVAQRFEDAESTNQSLDDTIDYVLSWRVKPQRVQLRMLFRPGVDLRFLLLLRVD